MGSSLFGGGKSTSSQSSLQNLNQNTNQNTNQNSNSNNNVTPPDFQMPFMTPGLEAAYQTYGTTPSPFTPRSYQMLPDSTYNDLNNLSVAGRSGYGQGTNLENQGVELFDPGRALLGAGQGMLGTGQGIVGNGVNLATGNYGAASSGASGILSRAMSDPTGANITDAGAYASNPYVAGMINAAQTPIERQLNEVAIPGLNAAAAGTGNDMSSRAGTAEAILRRNAGIDEANIASNIMGNEYNTGLNLAENARVANNQTGLGATGVLSGVGAGGTNLGYLGNSVTGAGASVAGAGGGLFGEAGNLVNTGNSLGMSDLQQPINVGQLVQQDYNARNNNDYFNSQNQVNAPWQGLQNYWNIVGKPLGYTSSGTSNTQSSGTSNTQGTTQTNSSGSSTVPAPGLFSQNGLFGSGSSFLPLLGSFF